MIIGCLRFSQITHIHWHAYFIYHTESIKHYNASYCKAIVSASTDCRTAASTWNPVSPLPPEFPPTLCSVGVPSAIYTNPRSARINISSLFATRSRDCFLQLPAARISALRPTRESTLLPSTDWKQAAIIGQVRPLIPDPIWAKE